MRGRLEKYRWPLLLFCLAYAVVMLSLSEGARLYGLSPYHRLQAAALLKSRLSLADSIDQIKPGLAWHNGHVQQVWGLGVGLWLLPFQAVWQFLGGTAFPDRIALGLAFALLAFYVGCTGLRIAALGHPAAGLGLIWIMLLCPPLWTLTRASQLVFEETVLYAILLSLGILIAVLRVACFDSWSDYYLCCALAAFSGLVRPTHAIYGFSGLIISSMIFYIRHQSLRNAVLGGSVFIMGLAMLGWTNWVRFGSPAEFGHKLTVSSGSMVYLTRFGNPFLKVGRLDAGKELFGLLFLESNIRDANAFAPDLFPGQSPQTRWRRLYLSSFDPSYATFFLSALVTAAVCVIRWLKRRQVNLVLRRQPEGSVVMALLTWSGISTAALGCFYLRFPIIASRYLLDFVPAITGFLILGWFFVSRIRSKLSLLLLAIWLLCEVVSGKVPFNSEDSHATVQSALPRAQGRPLAVFKGAYTASQHPAGTGIAGNGNGWEQENGFAEDVVILVVDRPEFVELEVSPRRSLNGEPSRGDTFRAKIGSVFLPIRAVRNEGDTFRVTFDIPQAMPFSNNDELLFLCFSKEYDEEDRSSERILYSVRWKR